MSRLLADSADTGPGVGSIALLAGLVALIILALVGGWLISRRPPAAPKGSAASETIDAPLGLALRVLAENKETARIRVVSGALTADLFMRDGVLYHAVSGGGDGNEAAATALRWDSSNTRITVVRGGVMPDNRSVTLTLPGLLSAAGISN